MSEEEKGIIKPENKIIGKWDFYIIILTIYTGIEIPLRFAFGYEATGSIHFMEILISVSFAIDILLNFRRAYKGGMHLITDPKSIAKRYMKSWFLIDLLATVPFFMISGNIIGDSTRTLRVLRLFQLNRLFKLTGLSRILKRWQSSHTLNPALFRLVFFFFFISIAAHWIACGWIILEAINPGDGSAHEVYSIALYWSITTLTTVGYGDITPTTIAQRYYTMMVMIAGVGTYGYLIGNIAGFLSNLDLLKAGYRKKLEEITAFLNYRSIPPYMQKRVQDYYDHLWESRLGHEEDAILGNIPEPLKTDLALYMRKDLIRKVPFFTNASQSLLRDLVLALRPEVYLPGSYIIRKGERGTCMYIISNGEVEVVSQDEQRTYAVLGEGSFVGEMSIMFDQPRTANVKTKDYCDLYILEKSDFDEILTRHPDFSKHMQKVSKERLNHYTTKKKAALDQKSAQDKREKKLKKDLSK